jgi:hypothetical protein
MLFKLCQLEKRGVTDEVNYVSCYSAHRVLILTVCDGIADSLTILLVMFLFVLYFAILDAEGVQTNVSVEE